MRAFPETSYRGVAAYPRDWSDPRAALGLRAVPHFSTLRKVAAGLKEKTPTPS